MTVQEAVREAIYRAAVRQGIDEQQARRIASTWNVWRHDTPAEPPTVPIRPICPVTVEVKPLLRGGTDI